METIPMNLRRLVQDVLPKGYAVAQVGQDLPAEGYAYYYVLDDDGRRRTFSHARATLEELYGEIRKLAVEVRRLDYWKRKAAITDADIDALVASVCTNLPKQKGRLWGRAETDLVTACCGQAVPAGSWWIHEETALAGQLTRVSDKVHGDRVFADARSFGAYLIARKESRFERGVRQ